MELKEIKTYTHKNGHKQLYEHYFVNKKGKQGVCKEYYRSGNLWILSFYKNNLLDGKNEMFTYLDTHVKIEINFVKNGSKFGQGFIKRVSY